MSLSSEPLANGPFNQLDLTGKLIIKVQLGNDIRRIPIMNDDITYDELLLMMQRIYKDRISNTDEILIKYKDEVNDRPKPLEHDQVKHLRKELHQIRNRVNQILDCLDDIAAPTGGDSKEISAGDAALEDDSSHSEPPQRAIPYSKEFDPLTTPVEQKPSVTSVSGHSDADSLPPGNLERPSNQPPPSTGSPMPQMPQQQQPSPYHHPGMQFQPPMQGGRPPSVSSQQGAPTPPQGQAPPQLGAPGHGIQQQQIPPPGMAMSSAPGMVPPSQTPPSHPSTPSMSVGPPPPQQIGMPPNPQMDQRRPGLPPQQQQPGPPGGQPMPPPQQMGGPPGMPPQSMPPQYFAGGPPGMMPQQQMQQPGYQQQP